MRRQRWSLLIVPCLLIATTSANPAWELGAQNAQGFLKKIMEGLSPPTLTRLPDHVVEGVPSDTIRDLEITSFVLTDKQLAENLFKRKHVQNSRDVAYLLKDMSRAEMNTVKWKNVMPAVDPIMFEYLDIKTSNKLPWDKMFPYMTKHHAQKMTVPIVKQIPPIYWRTVTPEVMGGLTPEVFGEIPVDSLNEVPPESFKYISTSAWKQLGPRRFSLLNNDILEQVSQPTYEQLGRPYLSRVEQQKLIHIQKVLPGLSEDLPPRFFLIPDEGAASGWGEYEKLDASTQAVRELTRLMRGDIETWDPPRDYPLVGDHLIVLPGEGAHAFSSQARESLHKTYWLQRSDRFKSVARAILKEASVSDIQRMDWVEIAKHLDAQTYNSLEEEIILVLPWSDIFESMPPQEISQLTPRTVSLIPPQHFSVLTAEQFASFSPAVFKVLTLDQLKSIPPSSYSLLNGAQVLAIGSDKINRLYPSHWEAIPWEKVFAELDDYKFFSELDDEVIKSMDFHRIFGAINCDQAAKLDTRLLSLVAKEHFRSDNFVEKVECINPDFFKVISQEQFEFIHPHAFKHMTTQQFTNLSGDLLRSMTKEQKKQVDWIRILTEADFNSLDPDFIGGLPPEVFRFMPPETFASWELKTFEALRPEQIAAVNWQHVLPHTPASTINNFPYTMWESIPPAAMSALELQQFKGLNIDAFDGMTVEHLHNIPSEHFSSLSAEQVVAIGSTKLAKIGRDHTDKIPIEVLYEAGESFAKAIGREEELRIYIETIEFRLMKRLLDSLNEQSPEDPAAVFNSFDRREWDMIGWQRVGRSIKCYQINTFDTDLIQRLPWQKLMPEMPPSTVECISSAAWDKIPTTAVKYLTVDQFKSMNPATVSKFSIERLDNLPEEYWLHITERTLVRWPDSMYAELPVEKLNLIKPDYFFVVRENQWNALGAERFAQLSPAIQSSVPEETRQVVEYMKDFEFPAEPLSEDEYLMMTPDDWFNLQGSEVTAIPLTVIDFIPDDFNRMDIAFFTPDQLNKIAPYKYEALLAEDWELITEENFAPLNDEIKANIPEDVRDQVPWMANYDLPPYSSSAGGEYDYGGEGANIGDAFGDLGDLSELEFPGSDEEWSTDGDLPGDTGAGAPVPLPGGGNVFKATCLSRSGCRVLYPTR